jgi:hypothetical protein
VDCAQIASDSVGGRICTARTAIAAGSQSDVGDAVRFFCNFAGSSELSLVARIAKTLLVDEQSVVVDAHANAREDQLVVAHTHSGTSDRLVRRHTWPLALRRAQAKRFVDWCRLRHIEPTRQRLPHGTVRRFMAERVLLPGTSANQLRKHARMLVISVPGYDRNAHGTSCREKKRQRGGRRHYKLSVLRQELFEWFRRGVHLPLRSCLCPSLSPRHELFEVPLLRRP